MITFVVLAVLAAYTGGVYVGRHWDKLTTE